MKEKTPYWLKKKKINVASLDFDKYGINICMYNCYIVTCTSNQYTTNTSYNISSFINLKSRSIITYLHYSSLWEPKYSTVSFHGGCSQLRG